MGMGVNIIADVLSTCFPVLLAELVLLEEVPLEPRVHLQSVAGELVRTAVLLRDDLVVLLHV